MTNYNGDKSMLTKNKQLKYLEIKSRAFFPWRRQKFETISWFLTAQQILCKIMVLEWVQHLTRLTLSEIVRSESVTLDSCQLHLSSWLVNCGKTLKSRYRKKLPLTGKFPAIIKSSKSTRSDWLVSGCASASGFAIMANETAARPSRRFASSLCLWVRAKSRGV